MRSFRKNLRSNSSPDPRGHKKLIYPVIDFALLILSAFVAVTVRLGFDSIDLSYSHLAVLLSNAVVAIGIFSYFGLYRAVVRYMGNHAFLSLVKSAAISALVLATFAFLLQVWIPRSVPFIYFLVCIALIGGYRFSIHLFYNKLNRRSGKLAIIYGAGDAGRNLLSALNHGQLYRAVGFVDDSSEIVNRTVNGVSVCRPEQLPDLIRSTGASYVFLAIPSLTKLRRREIIDSLVDLHVHVKSVPSMEDILEGRALSNVQEIDVDDLLDRDPILPDTELMRACVADKVVLVSGAGGSIGSELCRQIISQEPKHIILVEQSEYQLYSIEKELENYLAHNNLSTQVTCLLASVQDVLRMEQIFDSFSIDTVYHTAAYKHVPMVEHNILEGLKNNVLGTHNLVRLAIKYQVAKFTLISTDKAVRPTNVMGASKRFAELILQAYATQNKATRFCMVRFGNVLGSSGSVVPMFREQIRSGGPLTVTHKDVIRYFMTIPEAAQLVLQASAMGGRGDVFLLDMGEPVKILELARRMILLMGREIRDENNPDGDIEIEFTGLRPGEKLYEELLIGDSPAGTEHPKIMRAHEKFIPFDSIIELLEQLEMACVTGACDVALDILCRVVPEYKLSVPVSDTIWSHREARENKSKNILEGKFREKEVVQ